MQQSLFSLPCLDEPGHELLFISHPSCDCRLSCNIFGHIWVDGNWKGWEVWRFVKIDDKGTFIITSWTHDRKVLCSNGDGRVFTTADKEGSWEKWKISLHPTSHGVKPISRTWPIPRPQRQGPLHHGEGRGYCMAS
jgi:hypothetical protein